MEPEYVCIECGCCAETDCLYKAKSPDTIEIKTCSKCGQVLDKYLEYDIVIVLLDMLLMTKQAYRHLLFNFKFKRLWNMMILLILVQAFFDWTNSCKLQKYSGLLDFPLLDEKLHGSYLQHMTFFCALNGLDAVVYVGLIVLQTYLFWRMWPCKRPVVFKYGNLYRGLVVASFQQYFLAGGIIWTMLDNSIYLFAMQLCHCISLSLAHSVVCYTPLNISAAVVGSSAIGKTVVR